MSESMPTIGEFIEIPSWNTSGMVSAVKPSEIGVDGAVMVLLQEYPEQPERVWRWYRLAPGEWVDAS